MAGTKYIQYVASRWSPLPGARPGHLHPAPGDGGAQQRRRGHPHLHQGPQQREHHVIQSSVSVSRQETLASVLKSSTLLWDRRDNNKLILVSYLQVLCSVSQPNIKLVTRQLIHHHKMPVLCYGDTITDSDLRRTRPWPGSPPPLTGRSTPRWPPARRTWSVRSGAHRQRTAWVSSIE